MKVKTLYIDDVSTERNRYKRKFDSHPKSKDRFELIATDTPKSNEDYDSIKRISPDIILVDHDLSRPDANGNVIGISGLTLIAELKQHYPKIPLILFTKKSVFDRNNLKSFNNLLSVVDKVIYKSELFKDEKSSLNELYDLAIGYSILAGKEKINWDTIFELLGAPEEEFERIKLSAPPELVQKKFTVASISKWITEVLIRYPGIVYDSLHAATFLGISEEAFLTQPIQRYFENAKYNGLFAKSGNYWWKSRLIDVASNEMSDEELDYPIREGFHQTWKRLKEVDLNKSECTDSGESPAEWVCYVLREPMMINLSLPYRPDSRPEIMDEARISFKSIRTTNDVSPEMIDPIVKEKYDEVRSLRGKKGRGN